MKVLCPIKKKKVKFCLRIIAKLGKSSSKGK